MGPTKGSARAAARKGRNGTRGTAARVDRAAARCYFPAAISRKPTPFASRTPLPALHVDRVSPFEHISVLISIILGLGITQLLMSVHRLVQARHRVKLYWLSLLWAVLMFVAQVEWWWASYALRDETIWNFFYFLFVLLSPVTLYLAAAFALPEFEPGERYDLRDYYFGNRGWFFAFVAAGPALDAIRRGVQAGTITDFGAWSNAVSAVLVGSLAFSRNARYHAAVTLFAGGLFLFFIVSSALQLR